MLSSTILHRWKGKSSQSETELLLLGIIQKPSVKMSSSNQKVKAMQNMKPKAPDIFNSLIGIKENTTLHPYMSTKKILIKMLFSEYIILIFSLFSLVNFAKASTIFKWNLNHKMEPRNVHIAVIMTVLLQKSNLRSLCITTILIRHLTEIPIYSHSQIWLLIMLVTTCRL